MVTLTRFFLIWVLCAVSVQSAFASFFAFESGQVRPLALSPDGQTLYAVNTPDNRLEIFAVNGGALSHTSSVAVGLEPVAVAALSNDEVWVVNHLSDSVSIVDVSASPPRVTRTLQVGDEPRDIAVANGGFGQRVMVTTARRGQNWANHSTDPEPLDSPDQMEPFITEGIGRALVWVFDPASLGTNLEGDPVDVVVLFGDTPRALTVANDGNSYFAAVFHSGNQTTVVSEQSVCNTSGFNLNNDIVEPSCVDGLGMTRPGGLPLPHDDTHGDFRPEAGLIVKYDQTSGEWHDELGRDWSTEVMFDLPDLDVFEISTTTGSVLNSYAGVGTINFNMVTNPSSGKVYVSNTEAINEVRFEGPGTHAASSKPMGEPASVIGHLHESRISILDGGSVTSQHLNSHIDYTTVPSAAGTKSSSLATPTGMAVTSNGTTLYVAAFGSGKVGIFDVAQLEGGSFTPSPLTHITVGGGPSGLVLDEANQRLYVFNRFDNTISIVDTVGQAELSTVPVYNPEPSSIVDGRPMLYDANLTSSNGEASCASCHVFGDFDSLSWDLGNPDDELTINNLPINSNTVDQGFKDFHPMKGPMTTQTLRGMANHGALHWRGDRSVGFFGSDPTDEVLSFKNFIVAFEGLLGADPNQISEAQMDEFTAFILDVILPPNPVRSLDNTTHSISTNEAGLMNLYNNVLSDSGVESCNGCHRLDPSLGFFGADGGRSFEAEPQHFKVAHLRNVYQKLGMFGMVRVPTINAGNNGHLGDQVRGFGMLHDGAIDTLFRFLDANVFFLNDTQRRDLESFMIQFPTTLAPIVGQQVTLTDTNGATVDGRIDLLIQRAETAFELVDAAGVNECDLVVKGTLAGEDRGWLYNPTSALFNSDRASESGLTDAQLRAVAATPGQDLTYTCVPPGTGTRTALDRDEDGYFDQDEEDNGSDPADPASFPVSSLIETRKLLIKDKSDNDESKRKVVYLSKDENIAFPAPMSADDPRCNGSPAGTSKVAVTLASSTSGHGHTTGMPCENWTLLGKESKPKGYKYKDKALAGGTVKVSLWKAGKLKLVLQGKGPSVLDYDLVAGTSEGTVDLLFDAGDSAVCAACVGISGKDGSDGKKFLAKGCSAPPICGLP